MTHAVKLDLPQTLPSQDLRPEVIDLDIDFDGTVLASAQRSRIRKLGCADTAEFKD
jgi:hypothetical protein